MIFDEFPKRNSGLTAFYYKFGDLLRNESLENWFQMIKFLSTKNFVLTFLCVDITILEKSLHDILVNEEMVLRVVGAELLHAEDFATGGLIYLETNGHFAAQR